MQTKRHSITLLLRGERQVVLVTVPLFGNKSLLRQQYPSLCEERRLRAVKEKRH